MMTKTDPGPRSLRSLRSELGRRSRPVRRLVTPRQFKETYVNEALRQRSDSTYVEIGVRDGESFRLARASRKIGIDPVRRPALASLRHQEEFFEMTSDRFFDEVASEVLKDRSVDVVLIDGLHEFRHALRDLLCVERYMREDGVVVLDDCNPGSEGAAAATGDGGAWNGDVWKVAAYVRQVRPDLSFVTVDADQGVGVVVGFGASSSVPAVETVVEHYKALSYSDLDRDRAFLLGLVRPAPLSVILAGQ
jgi:Methyltransferase domain